LVPLANTPRNLICIIPAILLLFVGASPRVQGQAPAGSSVDVFTGKPRVVVLSDIGKEPDDQLSLVRFLLYSNDFDVEAIVASTSTWQKTATHEETMHQLIHAYGEVRTNLLLHAKGWPTTEQLDRLVSTGQPLYRLAATGSGKSTPGSKALALAIEHEDARPLWICVWGGANTLAQALTDLRAAKSPAEREKLVAPLRISSISDQDHAGPWIRREFPTLFYVVNPSMPGADNYYQATWTGISGDMYYRNGEGAESQVEHMQHRSPRAR
jgi:hypothetical protein